MNTSRAHPCAASLLVGDSRNHPLRAAHRSSEAALDARLSTAGRGRSRHSFHPHREGAFPRGGRGGHHRRYRLRRRGRGGAGRGPLACSPLNVGSGTVVCQHGTLPVPAPATLALLGDAPVYAAGEPMERVTPTGAALLRMLDVQYAPLPAMRILKTGYGAGGRETPGQPNLLRLLVGEEELRDDCRSRIHRDHRDGDRRLQPAVARLCQRDAARSRRMGCLSRLGADEEGPHRRADDRALPSRSRARACKICSSARPPPSACAGGWRTRSRWRASLLKSRQAWGKVRIKIARLPDGKIANAAPEYEDCRQLAAQHSVPLKQVMEEAMRALRGSRKEKR